MRYLFVVRGVLFALLVGFSHHSRAHILNLFDPCGCILLLFRPITCRFPSANACYFLIHYQFFHFTFLFVCELGLTQVEVQVVRNVGNLLIVRFFFYMTFHSTNTQSQTQATFQRSYKCCSFYAFPRTFSSFNTEGGVILPISSACINSCSRVWSVSVPPPTLVALNSTTIDTQS